MLFELFGKIRRISAYALVLGVIGFGTSTLLATPVSAATGINQQLNFQGRLLNAQGAVVADGFYNVEFKIYQDGAGTDAGNPGGTLKWTEAWLNNNGNAVRVVNGYISVQLGSVTPFGSSVDWNQDTLWLSVNIGNTDVSCTPFTSCAGDGEMTPMKRLSAVPYALNTGSLNGLTSSQFVQLAQGVQLDASTNSSIFINKTAASGNLVQLQQSGANVFTVTNTGAVAMQNTADSTSALSIKNLAGTSIFGVDTTNGQTVLQGVQDTAPLGSELHTPIDLTNAAYWTSTGWTTTATSATHTAGNTSTLQNNNVAITAGSYYQVSFDISGTCGALPDGIQVVLGGAVNPTYGGGTYINATMCSETFRYGLKAIDTTKLRFITSTGWTGTLSNISIKQITSTYMPALVLKSASGTSTLEIRTSSITSNQFIGLDSGKYNTTGGSNTANGYNTLTNNTTGSNNAAFGASALSKNTTGYSNTGVGSSSLNNNTSGVNNAAVGTSSLGSNTSGFANTAVGASSLSANTTGANNTATGYASMMANTTGVNNAAFGQSAAIANTTGSNNTAIGFSSLYQNTNGSSNVALGLYGLYNNTTGSSNTAVGTSAGHLMGGQFRTLNNLQKSTMLGAFSQAYASNVLALGGQGTNSVNIGIGTGLPTNRISAESYRYGTGTVTTDGTAAIVGTGTTFTSDMVGNVIYIASNSSTTAPYRRTITAFTDATHLTVSATVPALTNAEFYINYVGLQMTSTGKLGVNTLNPQYDIDVTGSINASVSLLAPSIDTATAGTLSIGTTNATGITLAKNVTVSSGMSLTLVGGATGTRPASPTEGMIWYDTDTKQLLTYANGKWQADRSTATKIVAASNASQALKDGADYVVTGTGDQTIINNALTAAAGGKVYLTEGTYTVNGSISVPNNTTLAGAGAGTIVTIPNSFNADISAITNTTTGGSGTGITIQDLRLEGNSTNQTSGDMYGIYFNGVGGVSLKGGSITNIYSNSWRGLAGLGGSIALFSSSNNNVINNSVIQVSSTPGIHVNGGSSSNNTITGNTVSGASYGILVNTSASKNTISGNAVRGSVHGITAYAGSSNTITGNTVSGSTTDGISIYATSSSNTVSGNKLIDNGGATANNAIYLDASDGNTITGNNITDSSATSSNYAINISNNTSDKNYLADNTFSSTPGTSTINDAGTGTVYANQSRAENGGQLTNRTANDTRAFTVQTAAGADVFAVDTTNSKVLVAGALDTTTATTLSIGTSSATSIVVGNTAGTAGLNLSSSSITLGSVSAATVVQAATQSAANTAGNALTLAGSTGQGSGNGGVVTIQGGNSGASGLYGGSLTLSGGTGTTANGTVILATSTFQTATTDSGCFPGGTESTTTTNCTISQNSINNNASVIVGFTNDGQTALMPDPSILTAGRVVYVTASNGSKDFTLSVNGGGQGNQISMRRNTTATMIWNGADWTAAGASSSTTMQAAYDNTLQSAGGAELVVSKTSATNGLTIRDSTTNSVNGALLTIQSSSAANLFSVNSNVTEYTTDSGAEVAGASASTFPAATWSAVGATTISRYNTAGNYIATGQGSVSVVTPATANTGVKNQLASALTANTTYNVSFTSRIASGTFTDMNVYYSTDGSAASVACTTSASAVTSVWQKINCIFTTPTSGISTSNAILIRQTGGSARTFYVDNASVTIAADYNFATDGSVNDSTNFATNWSTAGPGTVSVTRNTSDGYDASDSATATITSGAANAGMRNKLSSSPLSNTLYRVTTYVKLSSGSFTDFKIRYSPNGGTNYVDCVDYSTQTISTTSWTKVTCYITTTATATTNPYVYFVETASATRTFHVDNFSMTLSAASTPNIQVGGGVNGGPTTLFTLDKGASAPIASDNDALLGSMYYDTTLGKLQCYEADGWGACGSSPDNIVTISPEYTNAVLHGTGIGTMTSDICSDTLNINDGSSGQSTICGSNETYNFYKWTSPQASAQTYGIYVTYQLPSTFKSFTSGQTSLMGRTDSANATVNYQVYRNDPTSGLTACGSSVSVSTGLQSSWQVGYASGAADPSTCGFAPGDSIVFKISITASQNANTYVGNLNFSFSNR